MSNTTQTVNQSIYPVEWIGSSNPNYVIYGTALIAAGNQFASTITLTDVQGNNLGTLTLPNTSGFTSKYLGSITIPVPSQANPVFPVAISSKITCSAAFSNVAGNQHASGLKLQHGEQVPISYEINTYCNDSGTDNDWNDCVLTFQLFDASAD